MQRSVRSVLLAAVTAATLLGITACSGSEEPEAQGDEPSPSGSASSSAPTSPTVTTPPPPPPATTVEAPCPYVDLNTVRLTVGQGLARSTVTSTTPHPSCAFYRPDGDPAAQITVSQHADAPSAQRVALQTVGEGSDPIEDIGEYAVGAVTEDGAVLAATTGPVLVVVKVNQQSTLQAGELATIVVGQL